MAPRSPFARVAFVQRSLRRYRGDLFDRIRDELAADGIELSLYHSTRPPGEDPRDDALHVPWAHHLPRRTLPIGSRSFLWQPYAPPLRSVDLVITEQAADLALSYRLLWAQARGRTRVAFWGHGRNFGERPSRVGEAIKARISRRAHWWFAYTDVSAEVVADLGYPQERITVVNNAIDTAELSEDLAWARSGPAEQLRQELDLGTGPVGLFLGTLRTDKRLDLLLEAADRIHAARPDFRLLILGSGPHEGLVREHAAKATWIHFLGARFGRGRAAALALADVLLLPAAVGLVVVDSLAAGVPLVASNSGHHKPEIAYLRDYGNGRLVADDGDPGRYAAAVLEILGDEALARRLVAGCLADAHRYGLEEMAARFADGIRQALAAPPPGQSDTKQRGTRVS